MCTDPPTLPSQADWLAKASGLLLQHGYPPLVSSQPQLRGRVELGPQRDPCQSIWALLTVWTCPRSINKRNVKDSLRSNKVTQVSRREEKSAGMWMSPEHLCCYFAAVEWIVCSICVHMNMYRYTNEQPANIRLMGNWLGWGPQGWSLTLASQSSGGSGWVSTQYP